MGVGVRVGVGVGVGVEPLPWSSRAGPTSAGELEGCRAASVAQLEYTCGTEYSAEAARMQAALHRQRSYNHGAVGTNPK